MAEDKDPFGILTPIAPHSNNNPDPLGILGKKKYTPFINRIRQYFTLIGRWLKFFPKFPDKYEVSTDN